MSPSMITQKPQDIFTTEAYPHSLAGNDSESRYSAAQDESSTRHLLRGAMSRESLLSTLSAPPVSISEGRNDMSKFAPNFTPTMVERSRKLLALGLVSRNELHDALVAGNTEDALRLVANTRRRSLGSTLTPLHLAALFDEFEVAEALVTRSDVNGTCKINYAYGGKATALHFAVAAKSTRMIRLLVENGALITPNAVKTKTGEKFEYYSAAIIALKWWLDIGGPTEPEVCIDVLQTFLSLGWKINSPVDSVSRTMLHLAVRLPQEKAHLRALMVDFLLEHGASVLSPSLVGCIPLHLAARWNESPEIVMRLLQKDQTAQGQAKDIYGNTALHDAVWNRRDHGPKVSIDIMNSLLVLGAKVDEKNKKRETPLSIASQIKSRREEHDDVEAVTLLKSYCS